MIWLRYLLEFLQAPPAAVPLFCDNSSAVKAMMKSGGVKDLKEISRYLPYIRGQIAAGDVVVKFIPGLQQPADFLTKALLGPPLDRCRMAVGMCRLNAAIGQPVLTNCYGTRCPAQTSSHDGDVSTAVGSGDDWARVMAEVASLD